MNNRTEYQRQWYLAHREERLVANRKRRQEYYEWFRDYKKTLKCVDCGFSHHAALDFHHKDSNKKEVEVNRLVARRASKKKLMDEIAKCDVLCANCHRIRHYNDWLERTLYPCGEAWSSRLPVTEEIASSNLVKGAYG